MDKTGLSFNFLYIHHKLSGFVPIKLLYYKACISFARVLNFTSGNFLFPP